MYIYICVCDLIFESHKIISIKRLNSIACHSDVLYEKSMKFGIQGA